MARTTKISAEQILEAAREMFDRHGFSATTQQIASHAGISEGSIFRRWPSKEDLLVAALGVSPPTWIGRLAELEGDPRPVREQLVEVAVLMLDFFLENIPKMTAIFACGIGMRTKFMNAQDAPPVRGLLALTTYFKAQQDRGLVKQINPEIAARMFVSGIHFYAFAEMAGVNDFLPMDRDDYVRQLVDSLLDGIGVDGVDSV